MICLYLFLLSKEPAFLLQLIFYAASYLIAVIYLLKVQKKNNNKQILQEKLTEDIRWTRGENEKKKMLQAALEKKIDRFMDLRKFSEELKGIKDIETAARKIVKEIHGFLGRADECALYLINENQQQLFLVASQMSDRGILKEKQGSIFDQWVMKKAQGLLIDDASNDFRFPPEKSSTARPVRSVCATPMMSGNKVLGVLRVSADEPKAFSTEDMRLLDIFSSLGSISLKNLLLYAKMEEMAVHDGLTGLYLNRYFRQVYAEERRKADHGRSPFALIMMDIDHFKSCNDDYGHAAGDIVLKNIAKIIASCLGPADFAARYGGEEFIAFLSNKNEKQAMTVAESIRAKIEAHLFIFRRIRVCVTASFGVVSYPEALGTEEELLKIADQKLYHAKLNGRNRVCGNL